MSVIYNPAAMQADLQSQAGAGSSLPPVPATPTDPRISGYRGYVALVEKYGIRQVNQWRRKGGLKKHPTLAEIEAARGSQSRSTTAAGARTPATNPSRRR